jgi:hypothetical protein
MCGEIFIVFKGFLANFAIAMDTDSRRFIPGYLREKYQVTGGVMFTVLFSVLFLLVSIPFSRNAWFALGNSVFFRFTALFALLCLLILTASRIVLYKTRNLFRMTYLAYVAWMWAEIILICTLYTIFTVNIASPSVPAGTIFFSSLLYGFISLGIPDIIAAMVFTIINQDRTIRLMNMKDVVSDEEPKDPRREVINLFDNNGSLKLSVSSHHLYYIESDDNYIRVWYEDSKGDLKKYLLRCRLKTVEESFRGSNLVRCHRKFIVNMARVKVLRKEKEGYLLDLDCESIEPVPVTKT